MRTWLCGHYVLMGSVTLVSIFIIWLTFGHLNGVLNIYL